MKTLVYPLILGMSYLPLSHANSQSISEQQLSEKFHFWNESGSDILGLESAAQIDAALSKLSPDDRAVLAQLWISTLSNQSELNTEQSKWLANMASSDLTLTGYFAEHPEQNLDLINVSQSAKTAVRLHTIKRLALRIEASWQKGDLKWEQWLEAKSPSYAALIQWLKNRSPEQAAAITWQWLDSDLISTLPDNQAISILLTKHDSNELLKRLVQRKADEFTYLYFQRLPQLAESYDAINQLDLALDNPDLASQAILSLATHFSHYEDAQQLLSKALDKPSQQWYAIAALEKVKDEGFRNKLLKRYENDASKTAKAARKQLKKGESL